MDSPLGPFRSVLARHDRVLLCSLLVIVCAFLLLFQFGESAASHATSIADLYAFETDEANQARLILKVNESGGVDFPWHTYGHLTFNGALLVLRLMSALGVEPSETHIIVVLRSISGMGYIGTVLVGFLALCWKFDTWPALFASLLLAATWSDFRLFGTIIHPDTVATGLLTASFFLLLRFVDCPRATTLAMSAALGGASMGAKYGSLILVPAVVVALGLLVGKGIRLQNSTDVKLIRFSLVTLGVLLVLFAIFFQMIAENARIGRIADQNLAAMWNLRGYRPVETNLVGERQLPSWFQPIPWVLATLGVFLLLHGSLRHGVFRGRVWSGINASVVWFVGFVTAFGVSSPGSMYHGRVIRGLLLESQHVQTGHRYHFSGILDWPKMMRSDEGGFGLVVVFFLALLLYSLVWKGSFCRLNVPSVGQAEKFMILWLALVLGVIVFRVQYREPRYLYVTYPVCLWVLAWGLSWVRSNARKAKWLFVGLAALIVVDCLGSYRYVMSHYAEQWPEDRWAARPYQAQVIKSLGPVQILSSYYAYVPSEFDETVIRQLQFSSSDLTPSSDCVVLSVEELEKARKWSGGEDLVALQRQIVASGAFDRVYDDGFQVVYRRVKVE